MKTTKKYNSLTIPIFFVLNISSWICIGQTNIDSIKFIKHGTSFGMCSGYCFNETKFESGLITSYSKSWGKGKNNANPDKTDTLLIDNNKWKVLVENVNLIEFNKLPNTIGCPDCADGGVEWIEIGTSKKKYKVEFEYGKDIEVLNKLLELLRHKK
ncbi:hypothetical protein [Flavobacterium psychrotolerans]|uniref:Uncharacterized protein n=1 Tax=Flavobacterium psychrotolerans TaxID=2169410 RepID=A0A2U1JHY9_9FLAO|nr:hypothetical protein [Flavobacterium psychrotolerans]PWA04625.1 hypothetical protein DB895_10210 [Flavobacterium psychrotolerans]